MGMTWGIGIGWVGLAIGGLLVGTPLWLGAELLVTALHEFGHAAITWVTPGRVTAIRVHANSGGITDARDDEDGQTGVLFLLAGYPTPPLLGLAAAEAAHLGWATAGLWAAVACLVAVLLLMRNWFGLVFALGATGALGAFTWYAPVGWRPLALCSLAWLLLLGGVRAAVEQYQRGGEQDADSLARLSVIPVWIWRKLFLPGPGLLLPAWFWRGLFLAISVAAAAGGAWVLLT